LYRKSIIPLCSFFHNFQFPIFVPFFKFYLLVSFGKPLIEILVISP